MKDLIQLMVEAFRPKPVATPVDEARIHTVTVQLMHPNWKPIEGGSFGVPQSAYPVIANILSQRQRVTLAKVRDHRLEIRIANTGAHEERVEFFLDLGLIRFRDELSRVDKDAVVAWLKEFPCPLSGYDWPEWLEATYDQWRSLAVTGKREGPPDATQKPIFDAEAQEEQRRTTTRRFS